MGVILASDRIHAHEPAADHVWCAAERFGSGNHVLRGFLRSDPCPQRPPGFGFLRILLKSVPLVADIFCQSAWNCPRLL